MKILLSVALVCSLAGDLHGAIDLPSGSGNDFLRLCSMVERNQKMEDTVQDLVCTSYIAGLRDGVASEVAFAQSENKSAPKPFCLSVGVENGQLVKIALKYIKNHPEWAHLPTSVLLVKAWEEAFPCR